MVLEDFSSSDSFLSDMDPPEEEEASAAQALTAGNSEETCGQLQIANRRGKRNKMAQLKDLCLQHWHWRQFGFHGNINLTGFFRPKFRIPQCLFIMYRAFVAIYVIAWNIALHATWRENAAHSSFYYLSHWVYLLLGIYLVYAFIITLSYAAKPERREIIIRKPILMRVPRRKSKKHKAKLKVKHSPKDSASTPLKVSKGTQTRRRHRVKSHSDRVKLKARHKAHRKADRLRSKHRSIADRSEKASPSTRKLLPQKNKKKSSTENNHKCSRGLPTPAVKVFWVFHSTSCNLSIVITLMVYLVMYPYMGQLSALTKVDAITLNCHGINSLIVVFDLFISSIPIRILHFVYPALFGVLYVVFSAIYWSLDKNENILYVGILDWNNPGIATGISVLLIFIVVPIIQLIMFVLCLIRDFIHSKCKSKLNSKKKIEVTS